MPIGPGADDVNKQSNEITHAPVSLAGITLENKDITSDALLTQATLASYLVEERKAHYYFCVKGNQPTLLTDIEYHFAKHLGTADYEEKAALTQEELKCAEYGLAQH